ncbi:MAG: hypothetical protein HYX69_05065 [Planctomycetia bacterium]|nr:hypothetical protein [Planctomycetia bacterium]
MTTPVDIRALRERFAAVAQTVGARLSAECPRVVALAAKWSKEDLVPGLSDMDFRVVCDDGTTAEDWVRIDWHVGRVHREMVTAHPEWNRINEHTPGAAVGLGELAEDPFHHPEYSVWTAWWGRDDWAAALQARTLARPLEPIDEHYHLARFLAYFSPYIHGIDPPINLAEFEPKYALHSRCWHYFAPPMLSAATLLARRHFPSKRASLQWLVDHGRAGRQAAAVLEQVDAHYETPELTDPGRLRKFESFLFSGFEELLAPVVDAVVSLDLPRGASRAGLEAHLANHLADPLVELLEHVRFARIRAGRYFFYLNAPAHFSASRQLLSEHSWTTRLVHSTLKVLRALAGADLSPIDCFARSGADPTAAEGAALRFMLELADMAATDGRLPSLYARAIDVFPDYYRLAERALQRLCASERVNGDEAHGPRLRVDGTPADVLRRRVPVPRPSRSEARRDARRSTDATS